MAVYGEVCLVKVWQARRVNYGALRSDAVWRGQAGEVSYVPAWRGKVEWGLVWQARRVKAGCGTARSCGVR